MGRMSTSAIELMLAEFSNFRHKQKRNEHSTRVSEVLSSIFLSASCIACGTSLYLEINL